MDARFFRNHPPAYFRWLRHGGLPCWMKEHGRGRVQSLVKDDRGQYIASLVFEDGYILEGKASEISNRVRWLRIYPDGQPLCDAPERGRLGIKAASAYAETQSEAEDGFEPSAPDLRPRPISDLDRLLQAQADDVRREIAATLSRIDPYRFEDLIQRLLVSIGYENVRVTSRSSDGGVDVIAEIKVGITSVKEVVQVKRRQGSIGRPVLDQLRGSLHRFGANRGTVITSGRFSRGVQDAAFERGAAPITLIDGDRLIDLLIEHQIGVRKRTIEVLEFEPADFASEEELEDL